MLSAPAIGSASQPNGPALTLAHTYDVLWLSVGGSEWAKTLTSGPSGYWNATLIASTTGGSGTRCDGVRRHASASADTTEDPAAWTLDSTTLDGMDGDHYGQPASSAHAGARRGGRTPVGGASSANAGARRGGRAPTTALARMTQAAVDRPSSRSRRMLGSRRPRSSGNRRPQERVWVAIIRLMPAEFPQVG